MKRILISILICILVLTSSIFAFADVSPSKASPRVVRVGWFESEGVHTVDENGNPAGFDYEYLQALAQYTGWEYELVPGTWTESLEALKNGDIDLLNIVNKTAEREEYLDFCSSATGTEYCCLYVTSTNNKFSYNDFEKFDGMTVAIEAGAHQGELLADFAKTNNFTYKVKEFPTLAKCNEALNKGYVDALLSSNTDIIQGNKAIAQFNPVTFYYATTKGNTELLKELNNAMNSLRVYNPSFSNDIYTKYYTANTSTDVVFTESELAFIQTNPEIKILMDPIWYPIESYDYAHRAFKGIVPDLLNKISEICGLEFTFVNGDSSVDVLKEFRGSAANIVTSITYDYNWANVNKVNITKPFLDASIICVSKNKNAKLNTVALVELDYISVNVKKHFPDLKPIYFTSMAECIDAVAAGKADCAYMNNYEAEYFMCQDKYQTLNYATTPQFRQKICLGISKDADTELYTIMSKCLNIIPDNEIDALIYENSYIAPTDITLTEFLKANPFFVIVLGSIFTLFVFIVFVLIIYREKKNSKRIALQNERYNQLATMVNEHIYEYSFAKDTLSFNNSPEQFFGGLNFVRDYSKFVEERMKTTDDDFNHTLYSCFYKQEDNVKEIFFTFPDQTPRWFKVTTKIIRDNSNKAKLAIGKLQDIQREHEERAYLEDMAKRDGLTGLYNAKAFPTLSEENLFDDSTLIILDVDKFKDINDIYGHYNGDVVLITLSNILREIFKPYGFVGRLGGDEFAVFLPHCNDEITLNKLANELLRRAKTICIDGENPVTLSIGITHFLGDDNYKEMSIRADKALYEVKNAGRNNFKII